MTDSQECPCGKQGCTDGHVPPTSSGDSGEGSANATGRDAVASSPLPPRRDYAATNRTEQRMTDSESRTCPTCGCAIESIEEGGFEVPEVAHFQCGRVEVDGRAEHEPTSCDLISHMRPVIDALMIVDDYSIPFATDDDDTRDMVANNLWKAVEQYRENTNV